MLSQTEENYLKAIYIINLETGKSVSTNNIAEKLKTKASSVTDMIKKLSEKKLVNYKKYKGTNLTPEGENTAIKILRKHRLWEFFLVDKLNYKWDEVHELAEQLEHIKSDSLTDRLEQFLNFPTFDPHGDPIPDKNGKIKHHKDIMLSSLNINEKGIIIGVKDSSSSFLKFLDNANIKLGSTLKVLSKEEFDNSITIKNNNQTISISNLISKNLFVKKIK